MTMIVDERERTLAPSAPVRSLASSDVVVPGAGGRFRRRLLLLLAAAGRGLGIAVPVLVITSFLTFLLGVLAKQQPAEVMLGDAATPEDVARINHELGIDRPLLIRYLDWAINALSGDLGTSWFTGIPVTQSIAQRFPVSLSIAALALLIAVVVGVTFGLLAAVFRGSVLDRAVTVFCSTVATLPAFILSIGLILVFGVALAWLPTGGYIEPSVSVELWLRSITLPAIALSFDGAADIARQLRTGLVTALDENYIVGARLRGLDPRRILFVHALRNGSGPAIAAVGLQIPRLLGGAVIAEAIFSLPGLGQLARDGAMRGDVPVVIGTLVVSVLIVLAASVLVNVVLAALRPDSRIR